MKYWIITSKSRMFVFKVEKLERKAMKRGKHVFPIVNHLKVPLHLDPTNARLRLPSWTLSCTSPAPKSARMATCHKMHKFFKYSNALRTSQQVKTIYLFVTLSSKIAYFYYSDVLSKNHSFRFCMCQTSWPHNYAKWCAYLGHFSPPLLRGKILRNLEKLGSLLLG